MYPGLSRSYEVANHSCTDVFNTEAHPFKAPDAKSSYGSGQLKKSEPFHVQGGAVPQISPNPFLPKPLKKIINPN
jgi:mannosyl-oligosaccharide alpha-1,2-mannosidase